MANYIPIQTGVKTDPGRQRWHNEDYFGLPQNLPANIVAQKGRLWIVADGMGGHKAGEVASQLAVKTILSIYYSSAGGRVAESLVQAVQAANQAVYQKAQAPEWQGMGTTVVIALLHQNRLIIANVGDSRAYLLRNRRLERLTEDDTWVAGQVRAGVLTPQEAGRHEQKGVLTRALGRQPALDVAARSYQLEPGDTFLLCSDGLTTCLDDQQIAVNLDTLPPQQAANRLVAQSNQRGGPDNITVIVGHWPRPRSKRCLSLAALFSRRPRSLFGFILMAVGLGLVLLMTILGIYHFFLTDSSPYEPKQPLLSVTEPSPGLLFSGRLEQIAWQDDNWQLQVSNTGGNYVVNCKVSNGAMTQGRKPLAHNLLIVYGQRQKDNPNHIDAYFIDVEDIPYNAVNWNLWCHQSDFPTAVLVQTSLSYHTAFYIRYNSNPDKQLPNIPLSPPLLIQGNWMQVGNRYLLMTDI